MRDTKQEEGIIGREERLEQRLIALGVKPEPLIGPNLKAFLQMLAAIALGVSAATIGFAAISLILALAIPIFLAAIQMIALIVVFGGVCCAFVWIGEGKSGVFKKWWR